MNKVSSLHQSTQPQKSRDLLKNIFGLKKKRVASMRCSTPKARYTITWITTN